MQNLSQWILGTALIGVVATAAVAPKLDRPNAAMLASARVASAVVAPAHGHGHSDPQHLAAFEVETEEEEPAKTGLDFVLLTLAVGLVRDSAASGEIDPSAIARLHPLEAVAAHLARGPPAA